MPAPGTTLPIATTAPATTAPATTAPAADATSTDPTTTVVGVVDVAGPPIPAAYQQFGGGGAGPSAVTATNAITAAQGPLPSQSLPITGASSVDVAGVTGIAVVLLVAGLFAVCLAHVPSVSRRRSAGPV